MVSTAFLQSALVGVVSGDLGSLRIVLETTHDELRRAAEPLPALVVDRAAVRRVLLAWQRGDVSESAVQEWASFVMHGFAAGKSREPITALDIGFDADSEDTISEVLARLDELGDIVDGTIDEAELRELIDALKV